jgi:hypothetical protein
VSPTVTKTLQATFAPPTAHKQEKLNDLLAPTVTVYKKRSMPGRVPCRR